MAYCAGDGSGTAEADGSGRRALGVTAAVRAERGGLGVAAPSGERGVCEGGRAGLAAAAAVTVAAFRWFGVSGCPSYAHAPEDASECAAGTLPPTPSRKTDACAATAVDGGGGEGGGGEGGDADGDDGEAKRTPLLGVRRREDPDWARLLRGKAPPGEEAPAAARGRKAGAGGRSVAFIPSATHTRSGVGGRLASGCDCAAAALRATR